MRTRLMRTALALTGSAALLATAACGAQDETEVPTLEPPVPVTPEGEDGTPDGEPTDGVDGATEPPTDTAATTGPAASGDVLAEYEGVLAAIDAAVAAHDGAPAFEADDGDGGTWEIHVAVGNDEIEVRVSGDGSEVISSERDGGLDSDDRAGLEAAGDYTLAEALRAAIAEYGGTAPVDEVSIDEDGATFAWEVSFTDDVEVYLDIATGEVLRVDRD